MKGYLYLIESFKSKKCYLGSTTNPSKRIAEHNAGRNYSTKTGIPWICLLIIKIGAITEARKAEFYIKRHKERLSVDNVIRILNSYFQNKNKDD